VGDPAEYVRQLDDDQRAVAEAIAGPVVVFAGAGTGKTTAITHRIAYAVASGEHDPHRTLAVTFTNRAAGQMRSKLAGLGVSGVQVRTFHSAALRQLRYFWPKVAGNRSLPRVVAQVQPFLEQAAAQAQLTLSSPALRHMAERIEALRMQRLSASMVTDEHLTDVDASDVKRLWQAFDTVKTESGVMDFTDVLSVTVGMFVSHPELLREVQRTYRWFTVDEYQDVSPLQWDLLRRWRGTSTEICVVGDANQTIYTFAGASPNYLLEFGNEFDSVTRFTLSRCYRSTPQIVEYANAVMNGADTFIQLTSQRESGLAPVVIEYPDDRAEIETVANEIAGLIESGVDPRTVAVLFRTNAQAAPLGVALADRGVPVVTRGVDRFFQRSEIKEALNRLRSSRNDTVNDAVRALATSGARDAQAAESLATLVSLAEDFTDQCTAAGVTPTVDDFLAHVHERIRQEHAPTPFGVTLSTLHAAKGMEWATVYLIGCSEGLLPLDGSDIDEERRLCYVGMTRAQDVLRVSWAARRKESDSASRVASRFLNESCTAVRAPSGPGPTPAVSQPTARGPARCRVCGRALVEGRDRMLMRCANCPASPNPKVEQRLREWRDHCASARGVPPFQVLTDAAITALAELQPASVERLLTIPGTRWLGDDASTVLGILVDRESGDPLVEH